MQIDNIEIQKNGKIESLKIYVQDIENYGDCNLTNLNVSDSYIDHFEMMNVPQSDNVLFKDSGIGDISIKNSVLGKFTCVKNRSLKSLRIS